MTAKSNPEKRAGIPRTLTLSRENSKKLDRAAARLGITFSAALNLFLAGELDLKKFSE